MFELVFTSYQTIALSPHCVVVTCVWDMARFFTIIFIANLLFECACYSEKYSKNQPIFDAVDKNLYNGLYFLDQHSVMCCALRGRRPVCLHSVQRACLKPGIEPRPCLYLINSRKLPLQLRRPPWLIAMSLTLGLGVWFIEKNRFDSCILYKPNAMTYI